MKTLTDKIILLFLSLAIGLLAGVLDAAFGIVLLALSAIREAQPFYLIPILPFAGLLIIFLYRKWGKNSQKGMALIFEAGHGENPQIPKRLIPFVVFSTWLTHLFGGSAGREGVAVQIGGTIGHHLGKKIPSEANQKILLMTGMAAGFGGLFQTPLAAAFFAMEIFVPGKIEYAAMIPALVGAYTASWTSHLLGLEKFSFAIFPALEISPLALGKLLLAGLCFSLAGFLFTYLLHLIKKMLFHKLPNPYERIFYVGALLSIGFIIFDMGRYTGLGTQLIAWSFEGQRIRSYDWALKLLFTVVTLAAGFQGGEVTPLFAIGASLGAVFASIFGLPIPLLAAMGYVSVFAAATNSFLAPVLIAGEVFGFAALPYFIPVVAIAYAFNRSASIYRQSKTS